MCETKRLHTSEEIIRHLKSIVYPKEKKNQTLKKSKGEFGLAFWYCVFRKK